MRNKCFVFTEEIGGGALTGWVADQQAIGARRDEGGKGEEPVPAELLIQIVSGKPQELGIADGGGTPLVPGIGQFLIIDCFLPEGHDAVQILNGGIPGVFCIADQGGFDVFLNAAEQNVPGKNAQHDCRDHVAKEKDEDDLEAQAEQAPMMIKGFSCDRSAFRHNVLSRGLSCHPTKAPLAPLPPRLPSAFMKMWV